ncbi:hypothetical protein ABTZ59_08515 [Streptomyces sp. NPDC094034]|uniref:hypothetical protein n=1 Tax=Streptomyces sp. NPDC094034 TaxID=3155309 RepID=UPI00331C198A
MSSPVRMYAGAAPRLLRAAVFTAVCVVLSATGHVLAACAPVPWWTLLLGFLGVFAVAAPLAGRARSTGSIVIALMGGQLGLHSLFGIGQQHLKAPAGTDDALIRLAAKLVCGPGPASLSAVDAQRIVANAGISPVGSTTSTHQHMASAFGPAASTTASATIAGEGLLPSLPMVLGHLLAALATGWLLRRGDLALLRLAQLSTQGIDEVTDSALLRALRAALALVRALRAGLPGLPAPQPHAWRGPYRTLPPPSGETLQHTVIRRGPPAVFALAA